MFRRSAHAQKLSRERNFAQLRNTYHSIRLDELNQNLPSAHRLVEISTRYRRFTSAHAQLRNSRPISSEFADSDAARRDESNDMCLVSGRRLVPEISAFSSAHAQVPGIRSCRACAVVKRRYLGNEASPSDETHLIRFVSTFCT